MMIGRALISSCIVLCISAFTAHAEDELYLCGTVEEISTQEALVTVDVTSSSCRGLKKFRLSPATRGASFDVGTRKCFFINSSHCDAGYIYTIIKIETE